MRKKIRQQYTQTKDKNLIYEYWDYVSRQKKVKTDQGWEQHEDVRANPDQLPEECGYFYNVPDQTLKNKLNLIVSSYFKNCSAEDKLLLSLLSNRQNTVRSIAQRLHISPTTVQYRIDKIRIKLNRRLNANVDSRS